MSIMGGSYNEARQVSLEEMSRVQDFVKIEAAIEKMKAQNAKPE